MKTAAMLILLAGIAVMMGGCSFSLAAGGATAVQEPHHLSQYTGLVRWSHTMPLMTRSSTFEGLYQYRFGVNFVDVGLGAQWHLDLHLSQPYYLFLVPAVLISAGEYHDDTGKFGLTAGLGGGVAIPKVIGNDAGQHLFFRVDVSQTQRAFSGTVHPLQLMLSAGIRFNYRAY